MKDQDTQPIVLHSCDAEQPPSRPGDPADSPVGPDRSVVSAWGVFAIVLAVLLSFAAACVVYRL